MDFHILYITLFPLVIAFLTTVILTPLSLFFIKKMGLFDDPAQRHHPGVIHTKPVPRGGGIPLFAGVLFTSLFFIPLTTPVVILFFAAFLALFIGVLDDKLDISPYIRFFVNILTAAIIVGIGVGIPFITNPLGGILHLDSIRFAFSLFGHDLVIKLSDMVAIVWIVWVMNMLNWSKGVDGQMPGIVAISGIVIGILSLRFTTSDQLSTTAAILSFIIAGSSLGFLIFNFYPAKIFPGYGATSIYLLLSVVSLLSGAKLATAILVMGIPMVDGIFTIARRLLSGHSPFWHDNLHLHHILLRLGFGQRRIALLYSIISAILGALSLSLTSSGKFFAIIMLGAIVGGGLLFLHRTLKKNTRE